jgi:polysaccharide transporter, PST family
MVLGNVLFPQWLFQGLERLKTVSVVQVFTRTMVFAAIFGLVRTREDIHVAALLQAGGSLLAGVFALPFTRRALAGAPLRWPRPGEVAQQLAEGWHVFISTAATSVYTSSNAFFLGLVASPAVVGYFHIAERLIRAVQLMYAPISNAVYPHVSRLAAIDVRAALRFNRDLLLLLAGFTACITVSVYTLAPWVIGRFFGPGYAPAIPTLRVFALLPPMIIVSNVLGILTMLPLGMQRQFSRVVLSAALVDLVVFVPAAYFQGAIGAAWANVAVEAFVTMSMAITLHRCGRSPITSPLAALEMRGSIG